MGDKPRKCRHTGESQESATLGAAPTAGSRATTTNESSSACPGSDLHRCGKRPGRRRADSAVLGRGRSLDGPHEALTQGGLALFTRGPDPASVIRKGGDLDAAWRPQRGPPSASARPARPWRWGVGLAAKGPITVPLGALRVGED
jgi:hypothetical protein